MKAIVKNIVKKMTGMFLSVKYNLSIKFNSPIKGRYGSLRFISDYSLMQFKKIKKYNDEKNVSVAKMKEKIKFGFVVYTSSMWNVDELYRLLNDNERFDVDIIVVHIDVENKESVNKEYTKTIQYFRNLKYNVIEASNIDNINEYDALFYLTPSPLTEQIINLIHLPMSIIVLHTSYSYMLAGNMLKLDVGMYHWSLRFYTDSDYYNGLIRQNEKYTGNARYLGFPKMDQYYISKKRQLSEKKVIIYAPHHSVNYKNFKSATFEENYQAILKIAKKYSHNTYWIYKPHPLLRGNSVLAGVFKTVEDYDAYENEWQCLDNAEVVNEGDYFSIFKGSDAMITDSVSFLAEYQFTHKPLLLLESGKEKYNEFGEQVLSILYRCPGEDIDTIDAFVNDIIYENDEMYSIRKEFFDKNLSYLKDGVTANRKIYEDIKQLLTSEAAV